MGTHEDTGRRLGTLLAEAGTPDLPDGLVDDVLARAARVRRRRAALRVGAGSLAAAATVAGVVVGLPVLGAGGPDRAAQPASGGGGTSSVPLDAVLATPSASEVQLREAAALFPRESELGGLEYRSPIPMVDGLQPTVSGAQGCDLPGNRPSGAPRPAAIASNDALPTARATGQEHEEVSITVSAWSDDEGWTRLVDDSGACRWMGVEPAPWPGGDRPDRLLLLDPDDPTRAVVARRVGDVVVGVDVRHGDAATVGATARRIGGLVVARVEANGWPSAGVAR